MNYYIRLYIFKSQYVLFEIMFYIRSFFCGVTTNKLNIFCNWVLYIVRYVWKYSTIIFYKKNYNVRTIWPNSNHVYVAYYYTNVWDSTLTGIFFPKT